MMVTECGVWVSRTVMALTVLLGLWCGTADVTQAASGAAAPAAAPHLARLDLVRGASGTTLRWQLASTAALQAFALTTGDHLIVIPAHRSAAYRYHLPFRPAGVVTLWLVRRDGSEIALARV